MAPYTIDGFRGTAPPCDSVAYRNPNFWSNCCVGWDAAAGTALCTWKDLRAGCGSAPNETACHNTRLSTGPCVWSGNTCTLGRSFGASNGLLPRCPQSRNPSFCCVGREPELGRRRCFEIRARAHWVAFTCDAFASAHASPRRTPLSKTRSNSTAIAGPSFATRRA